MLSIGRGGERGELHFEVEVKVEVKGVKRLNRLRGKKG